jgi:hypothetical protein
VAAALADGAGQVFLSVGKFLKKPAITFGFLKWRQILALNIFDKGDLERLTLTDLSHDHWDFVELSGLCSPPSALTSNYLKSPANVGMLPH